MVFAGEPIILCFFTSLSTALSQQVSSIYADASIGNSIKIAVVHILYLHQDLAASSKLDQNGSKGKLLERERDLLPADCGSCTSSSKHFSIYLLLSRTKFVMFMFIAIVTRDLVAVPDGGRLTTA